MKSRWLHTAATGRTPRAAALVAIPASASVGRTRPARIQFARTRSSRTAAFVPAFCFLVFGLASCVHRTSHSVAADVPPTGWTEPVEMRYGNDDTVSVRQLRLSLRHSAAATRTEGRYVFRSVSPRGSFTADTLAVAIAPDARTGNKLSETAAERPLATRLAEPGEWRFIVTPLQNTRGVWSVAITVSD